LGIGGVVLLGCVVLGLIMTFIPRNAAPTHPVHSGQTQKFGKKPEQRPAPISIPPTGVIRISADDLMAQFHADEAAADRVFRDRTVEVTGKVVNVHKASSGTPVVTFGEMALFSPKVQCYFHENDNPKVLVGQPSTIRGRCMGKSGGAVGTWLQDCVVLPSPR
jgi:hypothetical protein